MKDIDDMKIGESFYLKRTVAVISTRTGKPCEFDEERIDVNALIIEELEKIKANFEELANDEWNIQVGASKGLECAIDVIEDRISELKGDNK